MHFCSDTCHFYSLGLEKLQSPKKTLPWNYLECPVSDQSSRVLSHHLLLTIKLVLCFIKTASYTDTLISNDNDNTQILYIIVNKLNIHHYILLKLAYKDLWKNIMCYINQILLVDWLYPNLYKEKNGQGNSPICSSWRVTPESLCSETGGNYCGGCQRR